MSLSKRERRAAEEAQAQKLRDEARAALSKKGISYDSGAAKRNISSVKQKYDNTLELIQKRKLAKLSQNQDRKLDTTSGSRPSASVLVGYQKKARVTKEAVRTNFGIPENVTGKNRGLPKDWVLVKQEHSEDYYFWNKRTNSTTRKLPSENLTYEDHNLNDESDAEGESADSNVYSCFDEESKRIYFWNSSTWKVSVDKDSTKYHEGEQDSPSLVPFQETVDGVKYTEDDWEEARRNALSKRQKVH